MRRYIISNYQVFLVKLQSERQPAAGEQNLALLI